MYALAVRLGGGEIEVVSEDIFRGFEGLGNPITP